MSADLPGVEDAIQVLENRKEAMGLHEHMTVGMDMRPLLVGTDLDPAELEVVLAKIARGSAPFVGPAAMFCASAWFDGLLTGITLAALRHDHASSGNPDA